MIRRAVVVAGVVLAGLVVSPGALAQPPGSNNWSCKPSAAHPYPIVLVHGTFGNEDDFASMSPKIHNHGYCVFALNYGSQDGSSLLGIYGIGEIAKSAGQLQAFVNRVLAATHASKVDIVGHSQGGMMPRYYLRFLGGAAHVHDLVGLAPSNHGTTLNGFATLASKIPGASAFVSFFCRACTEQVRGSSFLSHLNAGGDTVAGVNYTVIETRYDEVVTPYTSAFLTGQNVRNVLLPASDLVEHIAIVLDPTAETDVLSALAH